MCLRSAIYFIKRKYVGLFKLVLTQHLYIKGVGSGYPDQKKTGYPEYRSGYPKISVRIPDPDIQRFPIIWQPSYTYVV